MTSTNERESNLATSDFHDIEDDDIVLGTDEDGDEPEPSNKRNRVATQQSAEQWIAECNEQNPVFFNIVEATGSSGRHLQLRQNKTLYQKQMSIYNVSRARLAPWFFGHVNGQTSPRTCLFPLVQLNRADRETTRGFRNMLMHADPAELTDEILCHMPSQTQEVLGRKGLTPVQLLDMPAAPGRLLHRLTYFNIPVRVGKANIKRSPSAFNRRVKVKTIAPDAVIGPETEAKIYTGSSISVLGGYARVH